MRSRASTVVLLFAILLGCLVGLGVVAPEVARAGVLVEVMDQARLAGVADVAIAATPQ